MPSNMSVNMKGTILGGHIACDFDRTICWHGPAGHSCTLLSHSFTSICVLAWARFVPFGWLQTRQALISSCRIAPPRPQNSRMQTPCNASYRISSQTLNHTKRTALIQPSFSGLLVICAHLVRWLACGLDMNSSRALTVPRRPCRLPWPAQVLRR